MEKKWIINNEQDIVPQISHEEINYPESILRILISRGYRTEEQISNFFNTENQNYYSSFLMKGMKESVVRINKSLISKEKILIWGDYDADGVTSTSVLFLFLRSLNAEVSYYVPDREDGYALSKSGIDKAVDMGVKLIITVDCGITSILESKYVSDKGIDLIITDHHVPLETLPQAVAIIDPKQGDCQYPFKQLAGVGVVWKLVQGLLENNCMPLKEADQYLDIVMIGTIADAVPLIDENRKIVIEGLKKINDTNNMGLSALISRSIRGNQSIDATNVVFSITPKLNAVGRVGSAERAVDFLVSNDSHKITHLLDILDDENKKRRDIDSKIRAEVECIIDNSSFYADKKAIIVHKVGWHIGVIGIVASRIVEKYHRPAVVIAVHNGIGKGSCRSLSGIDVYRILKSCSDLLLQFGGHEYAAGLLIKEENIPEFEERFYRIATEMISHEAIEYNLYIDHDLYFKDIDDNFLEILKKFGPYGVSNEKPIFKATNVKILGNPRVVGKNHIRMTLMQNGIIFDSIGFNMAQKINSLLEMPDSIEIVFSIDKNIWKKKPYIQLQLKDFRF